MKNCIWLVSVFFFVLLSCQPQDENIHISKASAMDLPLAVSEKENITFIYQYNQQRANLEWTAVKLKATTGNDLTNALSALLQNYSEQEICKGLHLEKLTEENNQSIIHLSGKPLIKSPQDSTIFWSAFNLTMNRYTPAKKYLISMRE